MMKYISSTQNTVVKYLIQLQEKSRNRRKEGLFILEGVRELRLAVKGTYALTEVFFCSKLLSEQRLSALIPDSTTVTELSLEVYQKIAYRTSTEGVIAVAKSKTHHLESLSLSENPLILVAEAPEKPGNIGALLRTADAAHLDAVIIANPKTDLYSPNIIRSSVGCVFTQQIAIGNTTDIIAYLNTNNICIYAAILQQAVVYHTQDYTKPSAIVVGTEAVGLSSDWREASTNNIIIPMQGEIDSMNVSVAAGILVFEAVRQRLIHKNR